MQYDVIVFKSCYPVSNIQSDDQLAEYKSYYLSIRQRMDEYPDKIFIVVTPPPEIPAETDAQAAARARDFADWLASGEYRNGHANVFTFDFSTLMADASTNMLRSRLPERRVRRPPTSWRTRPPALCPACRLHRDLSIRAYIAPWARQGRKIWDTGSTSCVPSPGCLCRG
jgi:hypothetical protein